MLSPSSVIMLFRCFSFLFVPIHKIALVGRHSPCKVGTFSNVIMVTDDKFI